MVFPTQPIPGSPQGARLSAMLTWDPGFGSISLTNEPLLALLHAPVGIWLALVQAGEQTPVVDNSWNEISASLPIHWERGGARG